MPAGKRRGALVIGALGVVTNVITGVGILLDAGTWVHWRYMPFVTLIFYAISIALFNAAQKDEREAAEHRRASVRVAIPRSFAVELRNDGILEAQKIRIEPVSDADFQWQLEFGQVSTLSGPQREIAKVQVSKRNEKECEDCVGAPREFPQFTRYILIHHGHWLRNRAERGNQLSDAEERYGWHAAIHQYQLVVPMIIHYRDAVGRSMEVVYDLHLSAANDVAAEPLISREVMLPANSPAPSAE